MEKRHDKLRLGIVALAGALNIGFGLYAGQIPLLLAGAVVMAYSAAAAVRLLHAAKPAEGPRPAPTSGYPPGAPARVPPIAAGREIGECYSELLDPDDQRARFAAQVADRERGYDEAMSMDEDFIRALERGMPPLGGIGLGIDRLVMVLADVSHIREVLLFPALRPEAGREPVDNSGVG